MLNGTYESVVIALSGARLCLAAEQSGYESLRCRPIFARQQTFTPLHSCSVSNPHPARYQPCSLFDAYPAPSLLRSGVLQTDPLTGFPWLREVTLREVEQVGGSW